MRSSLFAGALAGMTFLSACGGDAKFDEKVELSKAALRVEDMMHEAGAGLGFAAASDGTVSKAMGATGSAANSVVSGQVTATAMSPSGSTPATDAQMQRALGAVTAAPVRLEGRISGDIAQALPPHLLRALVGRRVVLMATAAPTMMTPEEQADEVGNQLRRLFEERLFVDSNLESNAGGTATYLLHPDPTCRPLTTDSDPPGFVPDIDPQCQDDLTKVEIRIAASHDGDGVRLAILVGPARLQLLAFLIHSDLFGVESDLAMTKAAAQYLDQQLGDGTTGADTNTLSGKLRLTLQKLAPAKVKVALDILNAVDVAETSGPALHYAAATPLIALTGDGNAKTAELQLGIGESWVETSWDPKGLGLVNRDLRVATGGYYGRFMVDDMAKKIMITDAGIGQTTIAAHGVTIADLNFNASSGRKASGAMTFTADDQPHLELTPGFDLSIALDFAAVAAELDTPPDAAIANETYRVFLDGAGSAAMLEGVPATATFPGGVKVVAGSLSFSVASAPDQTVTVAAGQCLVSQSMPPDGANPFLGGIMSGACQ